MRCGRRRRRWVSEAAGILPCMERTRLYDKADRRRDDRSSARADRARAGVGHAAQRSRPSRYRIRAWTALGRFSLPGVYATFTGCPTATQREIAALLYAGPGSVITGQPRWPRMASASRNLGRRRLDPGPAAIAGIRRSCTFSEPERCRGSCTRWVRLRYVPPARAVADAARQVRDIAKARALVAAAVQLRKVHVADLAVELRQGPTAGSGRMRVVLAEVADGVRSSAEADLRSLIKRRSAARPAVQPAALSRRGVHRCPGCLVGGRRRRRRGRLPAVAPVACRLGADDGQALADECSWHLVLPYPPTRLLREPRLSSRDQLGARSRTAQAAAADQDLTGPLGAMRGDGAGGAMLCAGRCCVRGVAAGGALPRRTMLRGDAVCGALLCAGRSPHGARAAAAGAAGRRSCPRP